MLILSIPVKLSARLGKTPSALVSSLGIKTDTISFYRARQVINQAVAAGNLDLEKREILDVQGLSESLVDVLQKEEIDETLKFLSDGREWMYENIGIREVGDCDIMDQILRARLTGKSLSPAVERLSLIDELHKYRNGRISKDEFSGILEGFVNKPNFHLDFSGQDLAGLDLSGLNFGEDARFDYADLRGANFSNSKFCRASFMGADLRKADLLNVDTEGVEFDAANLFGAKNINASVADMVFIHAWSWARLKYKEGLFDEAERVFNRIVAEVTQDVLKDKKKAAPELGLAQAYTDRGFLKFAKSEYQEAAVDFDRALKILAGWKPTCDVSNFWLIDAKGPVLYGRGITAYCLGDFEAAESYILSALQMGGMDVSYRKEESTSERGGPPFELIYAYLGLSQFNLEKFDEAELSLNTSIETMPAYPDHYYYRAVVRRNLNKMDQAIIDLKKALELNPDYEEAQALLNEITS